MAHYEMDPREGRFMVRVFAEGLLSMLGHNPTLAFREFSGAIAFDANEPEKVSVQLAGKAQSLEVTDDMSKKDRREIEARTRDEVLETAKFPEVVFQSTAVAVSKVTDNQFRLQINGTLALHGVEKQQTIAALLRMDNGELRLRGDVRLKQSDYKIKRVSALGGAIRVKDELALTFDLVARRENA